MVKHTQTIRRLLPTNCLSVFDHFVKSALKGLSLCHVEIRHMISSAYQFTSLNIDEVISIQIGKARNITVLNIPEYG